MLQAGDCAESFGDFTADAIRDKLKVILQMAVVLTYGSGVPVVKVGRIAGQFAKPRSSPTELVGGVELPSFRGHLVNDDAPTWEARVADPARMLAAYHQSASTLNLLRAFTTGGFADLSHVHQWNQQFVASSSQGRRYDAIAGEIDRALRFMRACGIDLQGEATLHQVEFWTSHEALVLAYEEALTRQDSLTGDWYDCSAHLLWVGERTRQLDAAHLAFLAGVSNPLGLQAGADRNRGRGARHLPPARPRKGARAVDADRPDGSRKDAGAATAAVAGGRDAGHPVVWACDPMHGNTFTSPGGRKTRRFDDVLTEIREFFGVCRAEGVWPGGVHVELTGDDVTECLGGAGVEEVLEDHLSLRYTSACDPRLNARQSLDLAFQVAELLRS